MKLDFLEDINDYDENIIRLYDFNCTNALKFRNVLQQFIQTKNPLDISTLDFIEPRNCRVMFRITNEDVGIVRVAQEHFLCDLTIEGYEQMQSLIAPFCEKEKKGFQYLYDLDNPTDFLFAPTAKDEE